MTRTLGNRPLTAEQNILLPLKPRGVRIDDATHERDAACADGVITVQDGRTA